MVAAETQPLYMDIPSLRNINSAILAFVRVDCIIIQQFVDSIPMMRTNPEIQPNKFASLKNINQNAFTTMLIPKIHPIDENMSELFLDDTHSLGNACQIAKLEINEYIRLQIENAQLAGANLVSISSVISLNDLKISSSKAAAD